MTLGRKVGLYTENDRKKWHFYEIDGFKMGDFQIWQSDIFSILWNFSLEKLSFSVRFDGVYDKSFPFQKTTARNNDTFCAYNEP